MAKAELGHFEHSKKADSLGILPQVERPLKVVFLGAGSGFVERLFIDILNIPGATRGELVLVDIDEKRLELAEQLCVKVAQVMNAKWKVRSTTDRRKVLRGAQYIINCIEVSGVECVKHDNDIPAKYGVDQCIGDTIGPGGLMKALRTVPVFLDVLADVEKLCPDAWVLNYTNPMSIMCLAASYVSSAKVVGLCHSVQGTSHALARYLDIPYRDLTWRCGGINHLAWFTELSRNGEDLYPLLEERALTLKKEVYEHDPVRLDMMLHFGYFVTESSGHFSEYLPYYRKRKDLIKKYCRERYLGESGFYAANWPSWRKANDQARRDKIAGKKEFQLERSWEYASFMIEAMETHSPFTAYCTVPNDGLIPNLSQNNVCEVACMVDRRGVTPTYFGELPPQCAAICESNLRMFELAAIACIERSQEAAAMALMLDPLTSAVCCPAEIKKMVDELFKAEKKFLPGF